MTTRAPEYKGILLTLPLPVLFHPLKHHLAYIRAFANTPISDPESIRAALRTIGNSNPDIYAGELTPQQIAQEVILYLKQHTILEPAHYQTYLLEQTTDYKIITLSDGSDWVLRWGEVADRHVHIHPARYARHTFRVKATVLKTAIATIIESRVKNAGIDVTILNQARTTWLNLPPVPAIPPGQSMKKLLAALLKV